jgi:hypothetical protein
MVVILILLALPRCLDSRESGAAVAARVAVRNGLRRPGLRVEDAVVGAVEVSLRKVRGRGPFAEFVAGLGCDVSEDVGTDVPASQGV